MSARLRATFRQSQRRHRWIDSVYRDWRAGEPSFVLYHVAPYTADSPYKNNARLPQL